MFGILLSGFIWALLGFMYYIFVECQLKSDFKLHKCLYWCLLGPILIFLDQL